MSKITELRVSVESNREHDTDGLVTNRKPEAISRNKNKPVIGADGGAVDVPTTTTTDKGAVARDIGRDWSKFKWEVPGYDDFEHDYGFIVTDEMRRVCIDLPYFQKENFDSIPLFQSIADEHIWTLIPCEGHSYLVPGLIRTFGIAYIMSDRPWSKPAIYHMESSDDEWDGEGECDESGEEGNMTFPDLCKLMGLESC